MGLGYNPVRPSFKRNEWTCLSINSGRPVQVQHEQWVVVSPCFVGQAAVTDGGGSGKLLYVLNEKEEDGDGNDVPIGGERWMVV